MTFRDEGTLRRGLLALAVWEGLDLSPAEAGVRLLGSGVLLSWTELVGALDGADPLTPLGRERLATHARARVVLSRAEEVLPRPFAVPVGHPSHPGSAWVRDAVAGGALDLGLGLAGLRPGQPEQITPLPPGAAQAHGLDTETGYAAALEYLELMAGLAAVRAARRPAEPLHPMGQCDVVTLLAAGTYRAGLVAGAGIRTAAVPMRERGWLDVRRIDPEFVACAAAATEPDRRGFARPLLITADEVVLAGTRSGYCRQSADQLRRRIGPDRRF